MSELAITEERKLELLDNLQDIRDRVKAASGASNPTLVAVSKYKPASDVLACFEHAGQRDFGENYVQELVDKAKQLPAEIRWHFIGTLQSNKSKTLVAIPNLHTIQTLTSTKAANLLNKALSEAGDAQRRLNVLIQVNTSGEENKSGLPPLTSTDATLTQTDAADTHELVKLAVHVLEHCPFLRLQGLMTIGSIEQSINAKEGEENHDFKTLLATRDALQAHLGARFADKTAAYGEEGRLLVSMGMSADFEAALRAGSDIVRVGTGIFGGRRTKEEVKGTH
ncbi:uncharacterized protein SCHCODRAFT_02673136 [Schizophyllum commune H4-8]|uniref:Pyridoxal phosphate homeostasis protein n=1 Tax=Schizophyllum commune (strain H4-8 / FGSC 9210) TaxID=578458 RepID=D8QIP7_SCHCM|nr:uncharacterized protein SCHCODRAFT_02673136 [Schizophyllum commune H4-8]KAI5886092.1 hypothetical protein SCHCODRAFT_02673136 [Schizophyllum commune H4-8]